MVRLCLTQIYGGKAGLLVQFVNVSCTNRENCLFVEEIRP